MSKLKLKRYNIHRNGGNWSGDSIGLQGTVVALSARDAMLRFFEVSEEDCSDHIYAEGNDAFNDYVEEQEYSCYFEGNVAAFMYTEDDIIAACLSLDIV